MIPSVLEHSIWIEAPRDPTWRAIADVYEWPPHPRYFSVPFVTSYSLAEENGGTRLTFSEAGFEAWTDDEARRSRFERISGEFRMVLENLKVYLEGRNLPHILDEPE